MLRQGRALAASPGRGYILMVGGEIHLPDREGLQKGSQSRLPQHVCRTLEKDMTSSLATSRIFKV
jgi:hypothetical protein